MSVWCRVMANEATYFWKPPGNITRLARQPIGVLGQALGKKFWAAGH